jgi:predicted dehydrogenase
VRENGRIWQTGSWQRSSGSFHKAAEIVRNGLIGKVTHVEVGLPDGHTDFAKTGSFTQITKPPHVLDYERWIGPSRMQPYIKARSHMNWRWNYNTGGGQLMDWVLTKWKPTANSRPLMRSGTPPPNFVSR